MSNKTAMLLGVLAAMLSASAAYGAESTKTVHPCRPGHRSAQQHSLADKLDDCNGVLRPSAGMDPDIRVPAPDPHPGTTPVIRPNTKAIVPK